MGNIAKQKHARKLAVLISISLMNTFCAAIDRGQSKATLTLGSGYARAGHRVYGCESGLESDQRHHQVGGKAAVRYEHRNGGIGQVDLGFAYGMSDRSSGIRLLRREYVLGAFGMLFGWDFEQIGIDAGINFIWSDCAEGCTGEALFMPRFNLRVGAIGTFWFETGVGSLDAPFDGRALYGGLGLHSEWVDFRIGAAGIGRPMVDLGSNEMIVGSLAQYGPDLGGYARLSIHLGKHVSINLGGILAENYSLQLGLSFNL